MGPDPGEAQFNQLFEASSSDYILITERSGKGMDMLKKQLRRFAQEESGQDIIEYCLMLVFVALAVATLTPSIKDQVSKVFSEAVSALS